MSSTHEEHISLGNGIHAFITGVPDECDHKWDGPWYYTTDSGKVVTIATHLKWASYTDEYRSDLIYKHYESIGDPICGGGTTCSKCRKLFVPEIW